MVEDCGDNRFFVRCKCGIAQDKLYGQRCDAVGRWNTRKPSADIQDQIDNAYMHGYTAAEARYRDALRHGHWVASDEDGFVCSVCRCGYKDQPTMMGKPMFEHCPVCGARMDGEEK